MPGYTSQKDVLTLYTRQNGICAGLGCETKLIYRDGKRVNFIVEHRVPTALGGSNKIENKDLRCHACAATKTYHPRSLATTLGSDLFEINKAKTLEAIRLNGPAPTKHPLKSRGFQKGIKRRWPQRKFPSRG